VEYLLITAEAKHKQETQKTNGELPSDAEQQANTATDVPDTPVEQASTSVPAEKLPTISAPHFEANAGMLYQNLARPYVTLPKRRNQTTKETFVTKLIDYYV